MAPSPVKPPKQVLETEDIQGLVVRGYGTLPEARFLLLAVDEPTLARRYLSRLCEHVDTAKPSAHKKCVLQVAFTAPGLAKLELPASALASFSREFLEGMDDAVRSDSIGDRGVNEPSQWGWGLKGGAAVHVLLMLYAADPDALQYHVDKERAAFAGALAVVTEKFTAARQDQKEHFGWRDGLSMPVVEGVPKDGRRKKYQQSWTKEPIRAGEFVLGYRNEYDCFTESPTVDPDDDPAGDLPATAGGKKDLGRNGTYLVYREMTQHVQKLWAYLAEHSREPAAGDRVTKAIALGSKMVGRWPSGAPLVVTP